MDSSNKPTLALLEGGQDAIHREIVQDLLHFRSAEARQKCDRLRWRADLRSGSDLPAPNGGDEAPPPPCGR